VTQKEPQTLDDVCEFIVDCLHKTAPIQSNGYPSIRTPNVGRGRLILDGVNRVSQDVYDEWTKRAVPLPGDLILAREAPAGNVAVIKDGQTVCLGQRTVHLRPERSKVDPDFLCYFLLAPKQQGALLAGETGATAGHVNMRDIRRLKLGVLPEKHEQKKAGEIISAYDDLIENNRRRIALLEEAARMLYREWFVYFRVPGHEHVKITDGLPEGWKRRYLGDVVSTQYGYTASASDEEIGPKFLRGTDINKRSFIDWSSVPYCPDQGLDFDKYALEPGDILVIRMADPGKVALVEKSVRAVFASYLVRLKIRDQAEVPPAYLFMTLSDDRYQGFIGSSSGGATRKSASAKLLTDFHFALPPAVLLDLFVEQVSPLREMINKLVDQCASAAKARDLLLPRLMNGEIAV
jgi:type I restriction enzyme S subunit